MENYNLSKTPQGWSEINQEYIDALTDSKEKEAVYEAKEIAFSALKSTLSENYGVKDTAFDLLENVPIGLDGDSRADYYDPGIYGILIGGKSKVFSYLKETPYGDEVPKKLTLNLSESIAHEMTHMILTYKDSKEFFLPMGNMFSFNDLDLLICPK